MTTTAANEIPIWVKAGEAELLTIVSKPEDVTDLGVVLITGGGWMPSTHRNRMYVDLARELAELGCWVARFDYPGVGDSTGVTRVFDSMSPHVREVLAVTDVLRAKGVERVALVGTCYGGRTALAASEFVPDLAGLALSAVPVKDYGGSDKGLGWHARMAWSVRTLKRIPRRYPKYLRILKTILRRLLKFTDPDRSDPISRAYLRSLQGVLSRGVPILMLHGTQDKHYPAFVTAEQGVLGRLLANHVDLVTSIRLEGELHGELWPESQDFTRLHVRKFVERLLSSNP